MSAIQFSEILINNSSSLKSFAFSLTRDDDDAKDLLQETLYRALANEEKYHVGTNVKAWMYTIMRNIFINDYRKKQRSKTVFDASGNDLLINLKQSAVSNAAESHLKSQEIRAAIHQLPDIFRHPFVMYFEGFKYNEISVLLNEPLGTIKSRIHFARKLLKEKVSRYD
ncbi:MAG: sigma-70 family RNA polymerase sigma factor [Ferruginibacter sp.]